MRIRKTFKATVWASAAICVAAVLFLGVSWIAEYRPDARETVIYDTAEPVFLPDTLTVLSWNIGYAGLGDDMDFFYDGGKRVRDSRRRTLENLRNIVAELRKADADIMLLQEVDCDSHRSYGIREVDSLRAAFPGYVLSFAYNYRAWWVPIPLRSPMGRVGSGLVTLSRVVPLQAQRVQYPSAFPFPVRLFNLKRCLLALQFRTAGGDTVLIGNTHNTAYDAGGMRDAEMRCLGGMLRRDAARGVVSVVGGDWNQYPPGYTPSPEELSNEFFVPQAVDSQVFGPGFRFAYDDSAPSLRYLDAPWTPVPEDGEPRQRPQTTLTDFFLVSPGVRVLSVRTLPLGFRSSDHNPVVMRVVFENTAGAGSQ